MTDIKLRLLKILLLVFLLVYLTVVALLNLPPVRYELQQLIEDQTGLSVAPGYLYFNWRLNPVISSLTVTREDGAEMLAKLDNLEFRLGWYNYFRQHFPGNPTHLFRGLRVGRMELRLTPQILNNSSSSNQFEAEIFPDLELFVRNWAVYYSDPEIVEIEASGSDLQYLSAAKPILFTIEKVHNIPLEIEAKLELLPELRAWAAVRDLQIDDDRLEGFESSWHGELSFNQQGSGFRFEADMGVTPIYNAAIKLPEISVKSVIIADNFSDVKLEKLQLESPYFQAESSGRLLDSEGYIELTGDYRVESEVILEELSFFDQLPVQIVEVGPLTGQFKLGGKAVSIEPEIQFYLSRLHGRWEQQEDIYRNFELSSWEAVWRDDALYFKSGEFVTEGVQGGIAAGQIVREEGVARLDLHGLSQAIVEDPPFAGIDVPIDGLGELTGVNVPFSFSAVLNPAEQRMVFSTHGARISFEGGSLRDVWIVGSYSSKSPEEMTVAGRFNDFFDNRWRIAGSSRGPLRFETEEFSIVSEQEIFPGLAVEVKSAHLQFAQPMENWYDYSGQISFAGGALEKSGVGLTEVEGAVMVDSERINLGGLTARLETGELEFDGGIEHQVGFVDPVWKLQLEGREISAVDLFKSDTMIALVELQGGALSVQLTGPLMEPVIAGELAAGKLGGYGVAVNDFSGTVSGQGGDYNLAVDRAEFSGADLTGDLSLREFENLEIDLQISEVELEKLPAHIDPFLGNIKGAVSGELKLTGQLGDWQSWNGELVVRNSQLVMEEFPVVGGLEQVANLEKIGHDLIIKPGENRFSVEDGYLQLSGLRLEADNVRLRGRGRIGFDGTIDSSYRLILQGEAVRRYLQDVLGDLYRQIGIGRERRIEIGFEVKGELASPKVEVDRDAVRRDFRDGLVRDILSDVLGKPVSEILRFFFD